MNSASEKRSLSPKRQALLAVSVLAGVGVTFTLGFKIGVAYGRTGHSDVRKSCLVIEATAAERKVPAGVFVDGESGCLPGETHVCYAFDRVELWNCEADRP